LPNVQEVRADTALAEFIESELVDEDLVADLQVIPEGQCCLLWQADTACGVIGWVAHVESVAVVGEVDRVRHRSVVELVRDLVFDLAVDVEGTAWGVFTRLAWSHRWRDVGDLTVILQPGAAAVDVDTNIGISRTWTNVELLALALCLSLACCFFGACPLGCYLGLTSFANSCETLGFFTFFLSAQSREGDVNGAIEHWPDLTGSRRVEIADLAHKGVTGIPRSFAGLVEDVIKGDIGRTLGEIRQFRHCGLSLGRWGGAEKRYSSGDRRSQSYDPAADTGKAGIQHGKKYRPCCQLSHSL